jgi:ABC-type lipoprotein release transport system permease subunit
MIALFFLIQIAFVYGFYRVHMQLMNHGKRITALDNRPKAVVSAPQPTKPEKQSFEKPIIPGAKEVKPFQIGDGKLKFDEENQVAEWI